MQSRKTKIPLKEIEKANPNNEFTLRKRQTHFKAD